MLDSFRVLDSLWRAFADLVLRFCSSGHSLWRAGQSLARLERARQPLA